MRPLNRWYDWIEARYSKRSLTRAVVVLTVALLATQLVFVWYFGSVGLSLREIGYDADDRTVVIDGDDEAAFAREYSPDHEVGWCLYGAVNETHVRIDDVVHADPLSKSADRIEFTCVGETADQALAGENPRLIGTVHSHPSKDESELSRVDTMTWGRTSPVVEVMGIYTEEDGVQFFTVRSMISPLAKDVRRPSASFRANR
ncbi:hypothetical protein SAMN05216559_1098 [Halomicrobium zhouii]|uniref:Proteasome lid subunit RPN8/RPN11, contains Jab1/MPN metalloenzyme (JAMM) motif n=1 Tax=Halomicrobium zhouii TaxID=767519 RepID=A0A1I6KNJ2_9EURY|nr:hypothetical protein [Halomicrobium zhouii]SFR92558.1 hypothetical protein SAMN05216559_1098 [Halomicrobium zhouii]